MKTDFINASRYRAIEGAKGAEKALLRLMKDIGSTGKIVRRPVEGSNGSLTMAWVSDIHLALEGDNYQGPLSGQGETPEIAIAALLDRLLRPEDNLSPAYNKTGACLGIDSAKLGKCRQIRVEP